MAGLDDYQFFTNLREKDSPFWQKSSEESQMKESELPKKPLFSERLSSRKHNSEDLSLSLPMQTKNNYELSYGKDSLDKYGELSINIINLCAENLLSHPFIVIRKQCQVNVHSQRYHILPVTIIPAILHLQSCQGFSVLWKGLGSALIIRGATLALEDFISKFTPWPKEISPHSSLKTIGQHLLLKSAALAIITPFYSASLVETVQSDIASERPGILDVFREGLTRLLSFTQSQTVWLLLLPTVTHGLLQYIICNSVSTIALSLLRLWHKHEQQKQGAVSKEGSSFSDVCMRLQAECIGHLVTDIILFPMETIVNRLHLQGTRTIIDSLDTGYEVRPILTRYEGFFDCLRTTKSEEGTLGLFKGFGALCLQYALYGGILKFAHVIIHNLTILFAPPKPLIKTKDTQLSELPSADLTNNEDQAFPLAPGAPYNPILPGSNSLQSSPRHFPQQRLSGIQDSPPLLKKLQKSSSYSEYKEQDIQ